MWKFYGFHTYPQSDPTVTVINAESPSVVYASLAEGKVTKLYIYFQRQSALKNLTYTQFYEHYSYKSKHVVDSNYSSSSIMQTKVFKLDGTNTIYNLINFHVYF
jgi:hypothetical protein